MSDDLSDGLVYDSDDDCFYDSVDDAIDAWWESLPLCAEAAIDVPVFMETEPRRQPTPSFKDVRRRFVQRPEVFAAKNLASALTEALDDAWSCADADGTWHGPPRTAIDAVRAVGEAVAEMVDEGDIDAKLDGLRDALAERAPSLWWPTDRRIDIDDYLVGFLAEIEDDEFGEFLAANLSEAMVKLVAQATGRRA